MNKLAIVAPAQPLTAADHIRLGAELTALYQEALVGHLRVLAFGAKFMEVEHRVTIVTRSDGGQFGEKGKGMKAWLEEHAPEIARSTAYKFRDIAEAVAKKFKLAEPARVFALTAGELTPKEQRARKKVLAFTEEKSLRGLQLELGLVATRGGDHHKRDAEGNVIHGEAKPLVCPDWATESERALFGTLKTEGQRAAFLDWRPRMRQMADQVRDPVHGFLAELDEATKADLVAAVVELLGFIAPHTLKHAPKS
jgi:hypothetical protein